MWLWNFAHNMTPFHTYELLAILVGVLMAVLFVIEKLRNRSAGEEKASPALEPTPKTETVPEPEANPEEETSEPEATPAEEAPEPSAEPKPESENNEEGTI